MFEDHIKDSFSFPIVGARIIKRKLEKDGIPLNEEQVKALEKTLQSIDSDSITFSIDFDDEQLEEFGLSKDEIIRIDVGDSDDELDEIYDEFFSKLTESIPEIVSEISEPILSSLRKNSPSMLRERNRIKNKFNKNLGKLWKKPLNLLEMLAHQ